jgi:hypothetical protein
MNHEHRRIWSAGALRLGSGQACSRFGVPERAGKRPAAAFHRLLPVVLPAGLLCFAQLHATTAAGVVGTGTSESCVGDCSDDGAVSIDEIITLVNIALGNAGVGGCTAGDANVNGQITIDEILMAVSSALNGCPVPEVSGTLQRDQAAIVSSTCAAGVTARVQSSIDAGEWNCTYNIAQSGPNLTITETCPDGTDTFPGTVDTAGCVTVVRTEQETQDSCTFTQTSRFEVDGTASPSTGLGQLQFDFSAGCGFTDCVIVVESRYSRL